MCGGASERLWPMTNDARGKYCLQVLPKAGGGTETLIQRMEGQLWAAGVELEDMYYVTCKEQEEALRLELGEEANILVEPSRRGTFPAISLAVTYLLEKEHVRGDEPIICVPADTYADEIYAEDLMKMGERIVHRKEKLLLMGLFPYCYPDDYGYMVLKDKVDNGYSRVKRFVEKPSAEEALRLTAEGAKWNAGVFAFLAGWMKKTLINKIGHADYTWITENYDKLPMTSFDREVAEKEPSVSAAIYKGGWEDLGNWAGMSERMFLPVAGEAIIDETCENTSVFNELELPVLVMGISNAIVCATPDGILLADKKRSRQIKNYIHPFRTRPMQEQKRWGKYRVLTLKEYEDGSSALTKIMEIEEGKSISYQRHAKRDEIWTVLEGSGEVMLDGKTSVIHRGSVIEIKAGVQHKVQAIDNLQIIEVQLGSELSEGDIERFPD